MPCMFVSKLLQDNNFIMDKKYLAYGLLAVGAVAAGWYVWGLSTVTDRAKVTKVDIAAVSLTSLTLNLTITNFATVSIPFNGFYGMVKAQGYDLSDVSISPNANQKTIPAGGVVVFQVKGTINWTQLAGLIPDIVNQISAGNWKQVITQLQPRLIGDIYSNNLSASIDMPLV